MRYNRDVVFFLVLIFCCLYSTTAIPDICGDYDNCVECTNSNCNDSSKFLQNVCNNITSGCICKHGLTGSVCDQDCENGSYGIACRKRCDCEVMFCDKANGCTNTEDNDESGYFTSSRPSPETRGSVIPSTSQVTLMSETPPLRTDHNFGDVKTNTGDIDDGLPTDSISTGTMVAIVIAWIFGITVFVLILLFMMRSCELRIVQRGKELREKLEEEALSAAGKIVNGESTTISRYPWQVSLQSSILPPIFPFSHICGGTIINAKWVVTAAHCVDGTSASSLQIRAGGTEHTAATSTISVSRIIMHPNYNGNGAGYPNDIALLELSSSLQLGTNTVDKIRLAEPRDGDMAGQRCWLSGWGRTSGGSNTLRLLCNMWV